MCVLVAAALVVVTGGDSAPPALRVDGATVEATGPDGADATYTVKAFDPSTGAALAATCDTPPGTTGSGQFSVTSHYPLGSTTVTCATTTSENTQVTKSVAVTVEDTTAPSVVVPGAVTVTTTDPSGAVVTYAAATATDIVDGGLPAACTPGSGSKFPVGSTTVVCTATDAHSNTGSGSFTVSVSLIDTTPPTLTVPADFTVQSSQSAGATVTYSASATDTVDGTITPNCNPASGSSFAIGTTTVACTATDAHGNSAQKTFKVTVVLVDATPPVLHNVPANVAREADGAAGSVVSYTTPTAVDNIDGPVPVACTPSSGTTFPLGRTIVTCVAKDSRGNSASANFTITIVDTTPPRVAVPPNSFVYATSDAGIPVTDPAVQAYLATATATDLVDPKPAVTTNAPAVLPIGDTTIEFRARDASGNVATRTSVLTVKPVPPPGTPQPPPPTVDRTPPDDVRALKTSVGNRLIRLRWTLPKAKDFDHVEISRSLAEPGSPQTTVYRGKGKAFADRKVDNNIAYRYVLTSFDEAGNSSTGVAVTLTPKRPLLVSPPDGVELRAPPKLVWVASAAEPSSAGGTIRPRYYNVQLWRGPKKVLSAWPVKSSLVLRKAWRYDGRRYRMIRGTYTWFVWPGIGPKSDRKYGSLLGYSTFTIVR
jgi:HYR domain